MTDYIAFCRKFYAATGIPVDLLYMGTPVYSSLGEMIQYTATSQRTIYTPERNPEFNALSPELEYGHVMIEGTGYDMFLGPIFTVPLTDDVVREFFRQEFIPDEYHETLTEILYSMPVGNHPQFVRYLLFLHLCLNHKDVTTDSFYSEMNDKTLRRRQQHTRESVQAKEEELLRSSWEFEQQLYSFIKRGSTEHMRHFLETVSTIPEEGKLAQSPLRHAKNLFITFASKAAVLGAIPGGIEPDRAYKLTEMYIMECERMQTIDEIHRLRYIMLMDLCQRCGQARLPEGISPDIFRAMNYIRSHTNETITVPDIAKHIHRSESWLMHQFKKETGMQAGAYITKCKMEEAADLLRYSSQSLSQISAYLGYSSQSYFQNVFRKYYGTTPMKYRTDNR